MSPTNEEIRHARSNDLAALAVALGDEAFFANRLLRQASGLGELLTTWEGGLPIGTVYLWQEPAEEPEVREHVPGVPLLNHVMVIPGRRNRGVGTRLITAAERLLVKRGHDQVALAVETTNADAERLYKRLGYQRWDSTRWSAHRSSGS